MSTGERREAKSSTKSEALLNDPGVIDHVFVYEGEAQPKDDLCFLLDEIVKRQVDCAKARKKCREDLLQLRADCESLRKTSDEYSANQKKNMASISKKLG